MKDKNPTICVHGLGYIGLPTAAVLANAGYKVYGFDVDVQLRDQLQSGEISLDEADLERFVKRSLDDGFTVVGEIQPAEFHLICVPTPYNEDLDKTDLSYLRSAVEGITPVLREGDTVIVESTVPPGTTEEYVRARIEKDGYAVPEEIGLGYSPETVLPGNTLTELRENDRLIGTVPGCSPAPVVALYDSFTSGEIRTTDATTAEFVKLIQNAYRDVNIAFANEVAKLAREFTLDSREAIGMANNHPRVDILRPGPGVGGHCLPIDPLFLGEGNDIPMLIETARAVNDGMVEYVGQLLDAALGGLEDKRVTLLGAAYKGGVADTRESPSLALLDYFRGKNVGSVRVTDPYVDAADVDLTILDLAESLAGADAAVLVTDHPEYGALSPGQFAEQMTGDVVIDTRAMLDPDRWNNAGFDLYRV
ncbi:nucleotide sugar dehydrogenase [Salinarchaeum sp. IM2453]|uniref:nucleotide sugar dehydrogenase n=1 Tax=Salinarchaeum sp. IM2453 TaxID=2862870 RepID=UPI001C82F513|nr:nucleotide sugar dehydrogenase [Salinarchaeum sp. IM2453]QZA89071.1 nucleotide sugar dehydrogenase [Salinarchaeum sp. IM2453]